MIIGYTAGVYDLFHVGHLNLLRRAKQHCDYLIVGVNSDELVQEYKQKTPVIPYEERVEIVGAIRYVDRVVPRVNMDKFAAWEQYRFHKMFAGSDWKGTELYNEAELLFKKLAVEIVYFPYTRHISSSLLREKLTNLNS